MDMIIVEKASSLYEALQRANRAIMTLEMERPLYFFSSGVGQGEFMPEDCRIELLRHFRKVKETCLADIELL